MNLLNSSAKDLSLLWENLLTIALFSLVFQLQSNVQLTQVVRCARQGPERSRGLVSSFMHGHLFRANKVKGFQQVGSPKVTLGALVSVFFFPRIFIELQSCFSFIKAYSCVSSQARDSEIEILINSWSGEANRGRIRNS